MLKTPAWQPKGGLKESVKDWLASATYGDLIKGSFDTNPETTDYTLYAVESKAFDEVLEAFTSLTVDDFNIPANLKENDSTTWFLDPWEVFNFLVIFVSLFLNRITKPLKR